MGVEVWYSDSLTDVFSKSTMIEVSWVVGRFSFVDLEEQNSLPLDVKVIPRSVWYPMPCGFKLMKAGFLVYGYKPRVWQVLPCPIPPDSPESGVKWAEVTGVKWAEVTDGRKFSSCCSVSPLVEFWFVSVIVCKKCISL